MKTKKQNSKKTTRRIRKQPATQGEQEPAKDNAVPRPKFGLRWSPQIDRSQPTLRFTPYAWAKLHYLAHLGETEIGGFGLSSPDDLLLIEDVLLVKQATTSVSVSFDDEAVADLFDSQVDAGVAPERFARIWVHTHPGESAQPSNVDEETFTRVFGSCDWAIMMILARGGQTYTRIRFNVGPGGETHLPVNVDYEQPFRASEHDAWEAIYDACVESHELPMGTFAFDDDEYDGMDERDMTGLGGWLDPVGGLDDIDALINGDNEYDE